MFGNILKWVFTCVLFFGCFDLMAQGAGGDTEVIDLDAIVVTGSKIEQKYKYSTQNISIVTGNDIKASGVTQTAEVLDMLPSVDILEYGSVGSANSVHTRGLSSNQIITLVDGRPVNTPRDGATDFNKIPVSNIERIEVLRGPAGAIYGANAVGGVINVITKRGTGNMYTRILNKFGAFSTKLSSLSHGYKINDFDYFVSYDYLASHGHRDNSDYLGHNVNTTFGYELNDENKVSVSSGYYKSRVGTPGQLSNIDLDDCQDTYSKYVSLTYDGRLLQGQTCC